jgi:hypothetical protein
MGSKGPHMDQAIMSLSAEYGLGKLWALRLVPRKRKMRGERLSWPDA